MWQIGINFHNMQTAHAALCDKTKQKTTTQSKCEQKI